MHWHGIMYSIWLFYTLDSEVDKVLPYLSESTDTTAQILLCYKLKLVTYF